MKILAALSGRLGSIAGFLRPSFLPALIAASVIFVAGYIIEQQNKQTFRKELISQVTSELTLVKTRLRGEINANVAVIRSFANAISVSPDMAQHVFDMQANKLLLQNPQLLRLSTAPEGVITMSFPHAGNEQMIGTDFKRFKSSRVAMDMARNMARPIISGPVRLPSGKSGFTLFFPVFTKKDGVSTFWGFIEGVIDEKRLYANADVHHAEQDEDAQDHHHFHIQLSMRDASVKNGSLDPFYGDPNTFEAQPILQELDFPGGTWELAAVPEHGWAQEPSNTQRLRLLIFIAGAFIIVPILLTGCLVSERQKNIAKIHSRERQLEMLSNRLDLALDASKIGVWDIDVANNIHDWDERMNSLHDLSSDEQHRSYAEWRETIHPDDIEETTSALFLTMSKGVEYRAQYRVARRDGSVRYIRSVGSAHEDASGTARITGLSWDVSDDMLMTQQLRSAMALAETKNSELELALDGLSQREQELEALTRRLDLALDSYQCGMWEANLDTGISFWDERMHQLYGLVYTDGVATHDIWLGTLHPDDRKEATENVEIAVAAGQSYVQRSRIVLPSGAVRHVRSVAKLQQSPEGHKKLIGIAFDITDDMLMTEQLRSAKSMADAKNRELEQANDLIEYNALHDPLTDLGNRRKLDRDLERLSASGDGSATDIAVLHIDLDRFKQINDTLGHAAGDAMLVHASRVLRDNIRENDLIARIGGDEFVIVVTDAKNTTHAYLSGIAERIIAQMRQPVDYNGFACRFGVSIGIAVGKSQIVDPRKLLINADIALYRAKERGRNRHEFFTQALQSEITKTKRIADEILEGIENDEFVPWYQPQIATGTLQLEGLEALVRWNHPREGLLAPDRFLKIAEEMDLMATLDRIVLEKALSDRMRWAAAGIIVPRISVNVSAKRLRDEDLVNSLQGLSFTPGQISFELVESIFLDESDEVVTRNIEKIKALGIDIEIDDFGTGHTSIVSLLKIKPKRLKIDRQLVSPILTSKHERSVVRSIIEIGRSLNIEIVAEGVETMQHAELLSALGCHLLQGYAFAKPLSADAVVGFASHQQWLKAS